MTDIPNQEEIIRYVASFIKEVHIIAVTTTFLIGEDELQEISSRDSS